MALASVNDVQRVLRLANLSPTQEVQLAEALEAAESWFFARAKKAFDAQGLQTYVAYDVSENGRIELPVHEAQVLAVYVGDWPTTYYDVIDGNTVRLRTSLVVSPFYNAMARRFQGTHRAVRVDYVPVGGIPHAVRDGIARLAGWLWITGPRPPLGEEGTTPTLQSENLGGYSYTLAKSEGSSDGGDSEQGFVDAQRLLRPFMRRARVSVT